MGYSVIVGKVCISINRVVSTHCADPGFEHKMLFKVRLQGRKTLLNTFSKVCGQHDLCWSDILEPDYVHPNHLKQNRNAR